MSEKTLKEELTNLEEKPKVLEEFENEIEKSEIGEKEKTQIKRVVAEVISGEKFSGPIPHPKIIKGYEEVIPGAADRIITMAENQSKHRQELELMMVKAEARDGLLGILFAFILGFGCIAASIIIVIMVPENAGAISGALIGMTGIGSIIVTFIKSTRKSYRKNSKEDE